MSDVKMSEAERLALELEETPFAMTRIEAAAELRRLAAVERERDGWKQVSKQWRGAAEIIHGMSKEDVQSLKELCADRDRLAAEVAEWEKLRDPANLHAALMRGEPARLTPEQVWHLAADDRVRLGDLEAENVRLAAEVEALRRNLASQAEQALAHAAQSNAEVEALRADAERYRWLRDTEKLAWPDVYIANACHRAALSGDGSLVDAAIDAAMTGERAAQRQLKRRP